MEVPFTLVLHRFLQYVAMEAEILIFYCLEQIKPKVSLHNKIQSSTWEEVFFVIWVNWLYFLPKKKKARGQSGVFGKPF